MFLKITQFLCKIKTLNRNKLRFRTQFILGGCYDGFNVLSYNDILNKLAWKGSTLRNELQVKILYHVWCFRSICAAVKYFSLFLPTTRGILPEKSWRIWLPEFTMFWNTWGNSPNWEVDLFKLYSRLAVHQVRSTNTYCELKLSKKIC